MRSKNGSASSLLIHPNRNRANLWRAFVPSRGSSRSLKYLIGGLIRIVERHFLSPPRQLSQNVAEVIACIF